LFGAGDLHGTVTWARRLREPAMDLCVEGGGRAGQTKITRRNLSIFFYFFSLYFLFIIISCINLIIISCINLFYNVDNLFFFPRMSKFFIFYFFALERCGHIGWFG
jgi:hypothetical protein